LAENEVPSLATLATRDGSFAMLAIDQRESLRTLLAGAAHPSGDADLMDREYGLPAAAAARAIEPECGLIVAVDRLIQRPGGPLQDSVLDRAAMSPDLRRLGATALKFLVVWRPDDPLEPRTTMVRDFIDGCRALGLLSVLEGLVQVPAGAPAAVVDAAILDAATEFAAAGPDLYKTHVPTLGTGDRGEITTRSEAISAVLQRPWVVLSAGVPVDRFPDAVAAACAGGASGFLAGRGVWAPSIATPDPVADLVSAARRRLAALAAIASASARPWWDAAAAPR
jgi:sulfofructosephosphate aldolase